MGFLICANMSWRVICFKPKEITNSLRIGVKLGARHSTMCQKKSDLGVNNENRNKIYLIEKMIVS